MNFSFGIHLESMTIQLNYILKWNRIKYQQTDFFNVQILITFWLSETRKMYNFHAFSY